MKRKLLIVAASAALTTGLLLGRQAHALRELTRSHAYGCAVLGNARHFGGQGELDAVPSRTGIPTGAINTSQAKGQFACAVDDSNGLATKMTWVNVHMKNNVSFGGGWAIACTQFSGNEGGSCGAGKQSSTGVGGKVISLVTNWPTQAANGFPYVYIEIPPKSVETICNNPFDCFDVEVSNWLRGYSAGNLTTLQPFRNIYKRSEWWGELGIVNTGNQPLTNFAVSFNLPAGVHCNDFVPPGATLGPLGPGGLAAGTVSNYCRFTWANTTIAPGAQFLFNYSTDSQNFDSVDNIVTEGGQSNATCMPMSVVSASYDGPDWWGTIKIKNTGTLSTSKFSVEFDVPSGAHCNDHVPSGATLTPLSPGGLSQGTVSNHCVFTWSNTTIAPNATYTFNYSADTQSSTPPKNIVVTDLTCPANGI